MQTNNLNNINLENLEIDSRILSVDSNGAFHGKAPIIYLPGFGTDFRNHESFKNLLEMYDYYSINFPGHGNSQWREIEELTLTHFANIVIKFIAHHKLNNVVLISHSTSSAVAALVINLIPEKIKCNIMISPIERSYQNDIEQIMDIVIPKTSDQINQLLRLSICNWDWKSEADNKWINYMSFKLGMYKKNEKALGIMLSYLLSPELKTSIEELYSVIEKPTLIMFGDSDGLIRREEVYANLKKVMPQAEFSLIPLAGHEPSLDNPNNYFMKIMSFLDKQFSEN
ncbi:MAG: alpha/beta fold hydrolase [Mycoplasma sp.]